MNVSTPFVSKRIAPLNGRLALRGAADHQHPEHRHRRRREEDPAPADVLCHEAAEQRGEAGTAPGSHGPEADRALTAGSVPVRFDQRETCRHDEGARQALTDAAQQQERRREGARRRHTDEDRADDAEDEAPHQDLHAPEPIGQTTDDDDEDAREQRRDRHGDVHDAGRDIEIGRHRRRDVESGLGEQPEGHHPENDAEEELVIASVIGGRSSRHPSYPRFLERLHVDARFNATARYADSLRFPFQRSRVTDSRKIGNDHPYLIANPRTPNVTRKPAIMATRRPAPRAFIAVNAHAPRTTP